MRLAKSQFDMIRNGQKIIESRICDEKRQRLNIGDDVLFISRNDPKQTVLTKIKALFRYATFDDLFTDFPPELFGNHSKSALIQDVREFYSVDEEKKYGVVGIKIELVK
jgi:ASC-1-like (ASCH) protein